jgi:hypothetical protein
MIAPPVGMLYFEIEDGFLDDGAVEVGILEPLQTCGVPSNLKFHSSFICPACINSS